MHLPRAGIAQHKNDYALSSDKSFGQRELAKNNQTAAGRELEVSPLHLQSHWVDTKGYYRPRGRNTKGWDVLCPLSQTVDSSYIYVGNAGT